MRIPISELWDRYYTNSARASDIARQLSFAGIALIWVVRPIPPKEGGLGIPRSLVLAVILIVVALACDFLQYFVATTIWHVFAHRKERTCGSLEQKIECPRQLTWPQEVFFHLKVLAVLAAYALLAVYLWPRIW
jgi:hypothetical protein